MICRPDRVGDTIISSSCFEPLQKSGYTLFFMARAMMEPLFKNHPLLTEFLPIPNSPHPTLPEKQALLQKIKDLQLDAFVHLHPLPYLYPLVAEAGIPQRIGLEHKKITRYLTDPFPYIKNKGLQHEAFYNFDLLTSFKFEKPTPPRYCIHLQPEDETTALSLLPWNPDHTSYIVFNPTAHSLALRWAPHHFIELAQKIRAHFQDPFVIIGDRSDDPSVIELLKSPVFQHQTFSMAGKTTLGTLGWILKKARLLIGRNTGPSHLAAAVGCPTLELFGRMEAIYGPSRWHALGSNNKTICSETSKRWYESKQRFWKRSYDSISAETVYRAALPILEK